MLEIGNINIQKNHTQILITNTAHSVYNHSLGGWGEGVQHLHSQKLRPKTHTMDESSAVNKSDFYNLISDKAPIMSFFTKSW